MAIDTFLALLVLCTAIGGFAAFGSFPLTNPRINLNRVVGRCEHCGGNVTVPTIWHGVNPPTPTCQGCYATVERDLPILKMSPPKDPGRRFR